MAPPVAAVQPAAVLAVLDAKFQGLLSKSYTGERNGRTR
jgi:hypothetical protein